MILELVGSRIMAPFFGTSIIVWTSLIGIILGCLSLGYLLGGKIADEKPSYSVLGYIILISAIYIGIVSIIEQTIISGIKHSFADIRYGSIIGTLVIFGIPSVLLGMVSPYAVRLKIENLESSGTTVGQLYAISTVGSITGTFLAGFFLISYFGSSRILLILAVSLMTLSFLAFYQKSMKIAVKDLSLFVISTATLLAAGIYLKEPPRFEIDIDTLYNRIWIYNGIDYKTRRPVRNMTTDPHIIQSDMFLDKDDDLVYGYANFYRLVSHFNPDFKKSLMVGGAGYAFPKDYLRRYQNASLDVVEIDPEMTEVARKYFNLKNDHRLEIFHQDGRTFLSWTDRKYDVVFMDAIKSFYSIPYQLTTIEAMEQIYNLLDDDGVMFLNVIGTLKGENARFLRAELATCKAVFPQVYLFPVMSKYDTSMVQNIMFVALKSNKKPSFTSRDKELNSYLSNLLEKEIELDLPVLTDDFAPVEHYNLKMI